MIRRLLVCLLFTAGLAGGPVASAPLGNIVIAGTTLRLATRPEAFPAKYEGRFLLTGTYYYGDNEFNDVGGFLPTAWIIPDKSFAAKGTASVSTEFSDQVFLTNPEAFAKVVIDPKLLKAVSRHRAPRATGHIAIWVDQFEISRACDHDNYSVRFLAIDKPVAAAIASQSHHDC